MVEAFTDEPRQRRLLHHIRPVEEQVVVIEHVLPLLCFDVSTEEALQFGFPFRTPRKSVLERLGQRASGVHRVRVDGETRILPWEAGLSLRQT